MDTHGWPTLLVTAETNTTLQNNYISIKVNFKKWPKPGYPTSRVQMFF